MFQHEGAGGTGEGTGRAGQSVRGINLLFKDKSDGCARNASLYHVYPVSHATSEERAESLNGWGGGIQQL